MSILKNSVWNVYLYRNFIYVPNVARTEAGFFWDIEPVFVCDDNNQTEFLDILECVIANNNPKVPTPSRDTPPVILKYVEVKSWRTLEKHGDCFTIIKGEFEIEIRETAHDEKGRWIFDPSRKQILPINATVLEIARLIMERISLHTSHA
jgi:hypothetical protein